MYGRWTHAKHWTEVQLGRSTCISCLLEAANSRLWKRIPCLFSVKDLRQQGLLQIEITCLQLSTCWTRLFPRVGLTLWCGLAWKFNLDWEIIGDTIDQQGHQTKRGSRDWGDPRPRQWHIDGILVGNVHWKQQPRRGVRKQRVWCDWFCRHLLLLAEQHFVTRHMFSSLHSNEHCLSYKRFRRCLGWQQKQMSG